MPWGHESRQHLGQGMQRGHGHSKPPSLQRGHRPKLRRRSAADAPTTGKVSKRTSCFTSSVTTANQYLAKPFIKLNLMWCQIREENEQERKNKNSYIFPQSLQLKQSKMLHRTDMLYAEFRQTLLRVRMMLSFQ